jgi:hypothetical protein
MSASLLLTLDTSAPVVTWGAVGGTTAGELLEVAYQLDEPGLVDATLTLADGRILSMEDSGGRLTVLLPPDTPNGEAIVAAVVRDDVLNEATRTLAVQLAGTQMVPQPVGNRGAPPRGVARPERRRLMAAPSRVRAEGATTVRRSRRASAPDAPVRVRSATSTRVRMGTPAAEVRAESAWMTAAHPRATASVARLAGGGWATSKRDSPDVLALLDLI